MKKTGLLLTYLVLGVSFLSYTQPSVNITTNGSPQTLFALEKINKSLVQKGFKAMVKKGEENNSSAVNIILSTYHDKKLTSLLPDSVLSRVETLKPEGFRIHRLINKGRQYIFVIGKDEAGVMYGGLELAELIRIRNLNSIPDITQNPYMMRRGIKMNIPLDARTPSYTDASDAGQQNIPEMWSMKFWKEHIDSLASYRYNFISLWSLHPFPSLIKVPGYPDIALNDVHRSTIRWNELYSTRGTGLDGPDVVDHYEVVKKISIDDKIKFWQEVMQYAKQRNIDFYIITWNTFTNSTKGKYGITDDLNNPITKDYFRKSVKQLFITYPDLAGIGLTTGENMPGADFEAKENWSFETYGQGVLDVVKEQPDRKITFIHRQHETGALDIVRKFAPLAEHKNVNFIFSFKYAQAHVYSSTTQTYHPDFVEEIQSRDLKTLWTLRNDDVYYFRWGAPDFVREFIKNIPLNVSEGYYFGSDQHIWGREFMDRYPGKRKEIELAKHWYHWMLWGRLGYNPSLDNERIIDLLKVRYPETDGQKLFEAWQSASMIYPLTTGFHWGALDFQWYIEGSKSRPEPAQTPSGYHDVNRFITLPPHKGTDFISIPDYVTMKSSNTRINGTTPPEVASLINQKADFALDLIKEIKSTPNSDLWKVIRDIEAMAFLGKYYAHKINAATNLALFRSTTEKTYHNSAIADLNSTAFYWRCYSSAALRQNKNPLWTNRVGYVDWKELYSYALRDITDNGGEINLPPMDPFPGGTILETEQARHLPLKPSSEIKGYTGSGYISSVSGEAKVEWTFDPPEKGTYEIECRYVFTDTVAREASFAINNMPSGTVTFWRSGSQQNWVKDNCQVTLGTGRQTISISLPENVALDHINIIGPLEER